MNYKKNTTNVKVDIERVSKELQIFLIDRNRGLPEVTSYGEARRRQFEIKAKRTMECG